MPIPVQVPITSHAPNGVTTVFAYGFAVLTSEDLKVSLDGTILTSGFTVSGIGNPTGGTITFSVAPTGTELILYREVALKREVDYQENGDLLANILDQDIDRVWMALQDQLLIASRAVRVPVGETLDEMPDVNGRALRILGFDADGQPTMLTRTDDGGSALALDLLDTTDATKAAGAIGFSTAINYVGNTVGRWLRELVVWVQTGVGAVARSLSDRARGTVELLDFVPVNLHASIADRTIRANLGPYLRAAIDSRSGPITVRLPAGLTYVTQLCYAGKNGVHIVGQGDTVSEYMFENVAGTGGTAFAGDANTTSSLAQYSNCRLEGFAVVRSGTPANDPSIVVDLTSFSYSTFDIKIQSEKPNAALYYGQGNAGASPYFNRIRSNGLFGGTDRTQTGLKFRAGLLAGGSNGPNANMIGPITRASNLAIVADIRVGQGNMLANICGETISETYFVLGGNAAVQTGTSTGSNTGNTIKDTGKAWAVGAYINGAVQITAGTGQGQVRTIRTNDATSLTLNEPWGVIPDATSQYAIYEGKALKNKLINLRGEGLDSENPNFIYCYPGADGNEMLHASVESLGTGKYITDFSGSVKQSLISGHKSVLYFTFATPGASANVNAQPRSGVFGGMRLGGEFAIEWVKAEIDGTSHGGTATVTVDVGGASTGAGSQTLICSIPNGESQATALPLGSARDIHIGTNSSIHVNLQTDGSFSAGRSVTVAVCVVLVQ